LRRKNKPVIINITLVRVKNGGKILTSAADNVLTHRLKSLKRTEARKTVAIARTPDRPRKKTMLLRRILDFIVNS